MTEPLRRGCQAFRLVCRGGDAQRSARASLMRCEPVIEVGPWRSLADGSGTGEIRYVIDTYRFGRADFDIRVDLPAIRALAVEAARQALEQAKVVIVDPPPHLLCAAERAKLQAKSVAKARHRW